MGCNISKLSDYPIVYGERICNKCNFTLSICNKITNITNHTMRPIEKKYLKDNRDYDNEICKICTCTGRIHKGIMLELMDLNESFRCSSDFHSNKVYMIIYYKYRTYIEPVEIVKSSVANVRSTIPCDGAHH